MNKTIRLLLAYQVRQNLFGIFVAVVGVIAISWYCLGKIVFNQYDEKGTVSQQQVGTVTSFVYPPAINGDPDGSVMMNIRLGNQETSVNTHGIFRVGQRVQVQYKTGRSGLVYIENVKPVVAAP